MTPDDKDIKLASFSSLASSSYVNGVKTLLSITLQVYVHEGAWS